MTQASLDQLRFFAAEGSLYSLLDACDEPAVPKYCEMLTSARATSLYMGNAQEEFARIAPYLVQLVVEDLDWIVRKLWSAPWGYFVIGGPSLADLKHHFRKFLTVTLPDGNKVLYRFYDPRVLKTFLQYSSPAEVRQFFGPCRAFAVSSPDDRESVSIWVPQ